MSDEYPRSMMLDKGTPTVERVTVLAAPDRKRVSPVTMSDGTHNTVWTARLSPLPSPDDVVEVVVKMTRKQRDTLANWSDTMNAEAVSPTIRACRAHRDAES